MAEPGLSVAGAPEMRRVVITGLGAVSPVGIGADVFAAAVRAGTVGTKPITSFDASAFPRRNAGEVLDFEPADHLKRLDPGSWGRSGLLAAAAARLAVADAGIDEGQLELARAGAIMGTTSGESAVIQELAEQWVADGLHTIDGRLAGQTPASRIANAVSTELRLSGETQTIPTACSASNYALGYAYDLVRSGEAEVMLAGGADAVNRLTHAGFYALGAMAEDVPRPFAADRTGIVTGEGGAVLVLETYEHAVGRGARIYAEVLGYAANCDASHMVHPDNTSIAACIRAAHEAAGVRPEQIDYICAHGTGTPTNDATEVAAAREVFGERIPPISSIKSMLGHTMGAASGFGAIACCKALEQDFLPPTANITEPDPELGEGVDPVAGVGRAARLDIVQNHGFAFGGNNVITILGRVS
ncbi:beta-ketoacyl-[acyl-carrier-protein] synthase family protein [Streptomyces uncialis]|uniref:beta-ketoacyl-[acyl-carrier-protein] synthase family protein n=1 Tax=Streptomyces uncialis TaxID=1048205 RepID=UPI00225929A2|nr:beta-ketoacyl-[acyl-carrier-protein] synthase family protein [Streptomyces uncialis]MCX4663525.1 beta-ketoacyl-[acyl-carrier-protein] synthase family protein [Streptomyces uncialis]WTE10578.1 beta-ketoacyl-[acyl-carrier-protein] synthase family protein [Streptomyces uncialis]